MLGDITRDMMKRINYYAAWGLIFAAAAAGCFVSDARARNTIIKVAVVTPEGSTWTRTMQELAAEVKAKTAGEVAFKIYAGGISGDDSDVLRKMRANRIHAAGFSGVGLGVILPEMRILETPLLFNNHAEIDAVKTALYDEFAAKFARKGYVLLGFAEAGFVYLFSRRSMTTPRGLNNVKMWVWQGDPVAETTFGAFGVKTVPLHLADVNTGLETGMIDALYAPPLAAISFQWHAKVRYLLDYPLVNSTGALLILKKTFERLSPAHQDILRQSASIYCRKLVNLARKENAEALGVLKGAGIIFETPTAHRIDGFQKSALKVQAHNVNRLYSKELLQRVKTILADHRK
jgi:TRAP-type transport system periplasmic protein